MKCHRNIACAILLAALTYPLLPAANAQSDAQNREAVRACQRVSKRSSRLDCYDRAFPPIVESVDDNDTPPPSVPVIREQAARVSEPEPEPEQEPTARIVEVQMPNLSTTVFLAADGRTFVREKATTVVRWPDTPFDVEVQMGFFGTSTYLKLPGNNPRVRVVVRD